MTKRAPTLPLVVLISVISVALMAPLAYRAWRARCVSHESGLLGEVMHTRSGSDLYFNGRCWTMRPLPPNDLGF